MDNHPIPQDVTGFKFRIIGSITVKQFLFLLASGIAVAILFFFVPMSLYGKVPLILLLGGIGPFFAFIPIEGRPADVMIANFFRAVFANTLFLYHKQGANLALYPALGITPKPTQASTQKPASSKADIKRAQLARALRSSKYTTDPGETDQIHRINDFFGDAPPQGNIMNAPSIAKPPVVDVDKNAGSLTPQQATQKAPEPLVVASPQAPTTKQPVVTEAPVTQSTPSIATDNSPSLAQPGSVVNNPPPTLVTEPLPASPAPASSPPAPPAPQSPALSSKPGANPDFPILPDRPNVVLGIVRDPRGKVLPNIIVEVQDAQHTPLRTFKTDAQGKFSAATSMENGSYTISFDDPRGQHTFATMNIMLKGDIFQPVSVVSSDAREKLRTELFGGTQT